MDGLGEDREKQLLVNLEESGRKRADCVIGKINLEGNRGPIYNVVHQLKKKGKIEANGIGEYRICKQSVEPVKKGRMEFSNKQKNQLEVSIGNIEMYVDKYKKFDWINCSDEELQDARSNVTRLACTWFAVKESGNSFGMLC